MHGLLNLDKPSGVTSRDVVNQVQRLVRRITGSRSCKVGHAGTLDPLASGVLVVGIGAGTRLVEYVQRMEKRYDATFLLGRSSDTDDIEGAVVEHPDAPVPARERIDEVLPRFVGAIQQVPPAYSAVKVKGQRAYALARAGEEVELKARKVDIYGLEVTGYDDPELRMTIRCGSGVYVRAIGRDLARALGTEAVMSRLVRTAIGPFDLASAVSADRLSDENLAQFLRPLASAVASLPAVSVSAESARRLRHGQTVPAGDSLSMPGAEGELAVLDPSGALVAVARVERHQLRSVKNLPELT